MMVLGLSQPAHEQEARPPPCCSSLEIDVRCVECLLAMELHSGHDMKCLWPVADRAKRHTAHRHPFRDDALDGCAIVLQFFGSWVMSMIRISKARYFNGTGRQTSCSWSRNRDAMSCLWILAVPFVRLQQGSMRGTIVVYLGLFTVMAIWFCTISQMIVLWPMSC